VSGSRGLRLWLVGALVGAALTGSASVVSADDATNPHPVSAGLKAGVFPPILGLLEVTYRPLPHLGVGVMGIYAPFDVTGKVGTRFAVGPELLYELEAGGASTWYLEGAWLYYHATGPGSFFETMQSVQLTGGYEWKWPSLEVQLGAGLQHILVDHTPPCVGFCLTLDPTQFPVLPQVEVAARYRF
jgi:hypothetical protein